jgi:hypothetical protein
MNEPVLIVIDMLNDFLQAWAPASRQRLVQATNGATKKSGKCWFRQYDPNAAHDDRYGFSDRRNAERKLIRNRPAAAARRAALRYLAATEAASIGSATMAADGTIECSRGPIDNRR